LIRHVSAGLAQHAVVAHALISSEALFAIVTKVARLARARRGHDGWVKHIHRIKQFGEFEHKISVEHWKFWNCECVLFGQEAT
jgi:hypothetical protein